MGDIIDDPSGWSQVVILLVCNGSCLLKVTGSLTGNMNICHMWVYGVTPCFLCPLKRWWHFAV